MSVMTMLRDEIVKLLMNGMTGWATESDGKYHISVDADKTADAILALVEPDAEKLWQIIYDCDDVSDSAEMIISEWRAGNLRKEAEKEKI